MNHEKEKRTVSGWTMLVVNIVMCLGCGYLLYHALGSLDPRPTAAGWWFLGSGLFLAIISGLTSAGFMVLQPNEAATLLLFGRYVGSVKEGGFWWVGPFYTKRKISLRLRNLNGEKIVELDDERKAAMVSNLLVVLCGESAAQPVINTGTLYS